jgi:hypothetical protein
MSTIKSSTTTTTAYSVTADTTGTLVIQTGATPTTAVTIGTDQSVTLAGRTTNPTTISVGGATPSTSGSGITFPATQSASSDVNTLDDYEEGTWTPSFSAASGSATYTNQVGNYVKIGRQVTATFYITVNVSSSLTSQFIAGLPFTGSNTNYTGTAFSAWSGVGGYCTLLGLISSTLIQIRATNSATTSPVVTTLSISNGAEIAGTLSYFTS